MTAAVSMLDDESATFVDCMGEFFVVARKFDAAFGRGPFSLSITRPSLFGEWVASYGGVRASGRDVWEAFEALFKTLRSEVEDGHG